MTILPHEEQAQGGASTVISGNQNGDNGVLVTIFDKPVYMKAKSEEEDRPIYQDVTYIQIRTPAQAKSVPTRKIREDDKVRFPTAWQNYLDKKEMTVEGMPIEQWQGIGRSRALELKSKKILTVETLANVPDGNLGPLGPDAGQLKKKAKEFLAEQTGDSVKFAELEEKLAATQDDADKQRSNNEELAIAVKELQENLAEATQLIQAQTEQIEALTANPPKAPAKRGRPKNNDTADDSSKSS